MQLNGQQVVVVGLARSGLAVARFLKTQGAIVTITDQASEKVLGPFPERARELDVQLELGGHREATFEKADRIVISPGVPHTIGPLAKARQRGVGVMGEIELASRFIRAPIVAVSGTNGKTTTTELLGRMMAASGLRVFVGGNIGNPLIEIADRDADLDVVVAEISSFQLDTIDRFRPHVAVLLNVSPDHLDRYPSVAAYAASKGRLFRNQGAEDYAVCHGEDKWVQAQVHGMRSRKLNFFNRSRHTDTHVPGALISEGRIVIDIPGLTNGCIELGRSLLMGPHNRENIAAAALAALVGGGHLEGVQKAVDQFQPLAHRLEWVGTVRDVSFINDSKATNVDAVIRALECFSRPVVLIMGGRNKGYDFKSLFPPVRERVKKLIVIGEAREQILSVLGRAPLQGSESFPDLEQAVRHAYRAAEPGETVLLSPACSSFDMFANYAERGEAFRRLVESLT